MNTRGSVIAGLVLGLSVAGCSADSAEETEDGTGAISGAPGEAVDNREKVEKQEKLDAIVALYQQTPVVLLREATPAEAANLPAVVAARRAKLAAQPGPAPQIRAFVWSRGFLLECKPRQEATSVHFFSTNGDSELGQCQVRDGHLANCTIDADRDPLHKR